MLLGAALVSSLAMPLYVFFYGGLPEPNMSLTPPVAGTHHPTRAVHDRPREGDHFQAGVLHSEGRALGEHWAPYYVVEFTDFFCRHCQEAHEKVTAVLLKDWVAFGKVRLESHPVAFLEDDSLRAAHAAMCAQEQHKYWEVREMLLQVPLNWRDEHKNGSVFNAPTLRRGSALPPLPPRVFIATRCESDVKTVTCVVSMVPACVDGPLPLFPFLPTSSRCRLRLSIGSTDGNSLSLAWSFTFFIKIQR